MLREALPVIWGDDKQAKEGNRAVGHSGLCTKEFRKPASLVGFRAIKITSGLVTSQGAALAGCRNYIQKIPPPVICLKDPNE